MIVVNARFLTQQITGVQRFAVELSRIIHKLIPEKVVFVTPGNVINFDVADELQAIVIGKNTGIIWEQVDLRKYLILNKRPLLINFGNTGIVFYKKQIVTIHDMSYKINPLWFSKSFYIWYNFLIPHIANHSLKILTVSNSAKNDIEKHLKIKPGKINVIYNSSYLNTNNNFELIESEKYILTVSSLNPRKNLKNLISAFKKIEKGIKLVIVGLQHNKLDPAANIGLNDDDIIIKGHLNDDELSLLMKHAEALVYVSFYEGFGIPPIEAMNMGCPVIVSDIPAHREICGNAAVYADPNSIEDIKDKITEVLGNEKLKQQLRMAAKENVKRFDWYESAQNVLKIINDIV